ncbi:hypothetical protein [Streptomyces sp. CCM_MD2014]|uniref:hypothetical protein n=1 Tax=Streptomyces sp. CCM_MD2014 TaxID=1561022 RepID=UPI000A474024|nr:hypothetical protein [Streptomyces sp. CCM_MD2014]MDA4895826.1 hypothetical protein [Streptomyces sp. MS2A]
MTLNSKSTIATSTLVGLLIATTACDAGTKNSSSPSACERLLGQSGIAWLERSRGQEADSSERGGLKDAKEDFYRYARDWKPGSDKTPAFLRTEVCRFSTPDKSNEQRALSLSYGASILPFDYPFNEEKDIYSSVSVVSVNSDVKLVTRDDDGTLEYSVYVKCQVSDASPGQERGVPIEGTMRDALTGDTDTNTHLTYLLKSARAVVDDFSCKKRTLCSRATTFGLTAPNNG